jgi:hypothetical protein
LSPARQKQQKQKKDREREKEKKVEENYVKHNASIMRFNDHIYVFIQSNGKKECKPFNSYGEIIYKFNKLQAIA